MSETSEGNIKMLHHMGMGRMGMGRTGIPILDSRVSILSFMRLMKQTIGKK